MSNIDFRLKCWYEAGCNLKTDFCEKTCHRYLQMNYLINNCGMKNADRFLKPISPAKIDVDAYLQLQEIKDNIVQFVEESRNLYIISHNLQTGKTTWSLKIMYKFFDEIWAGNGFVQRGYFIHIPEFVNKTKSFQYKDSDEFKKLDKAIKEVDLVVWDDISSLELNSNEQSFINMYIDKRMLEGKSNIFNGMYLDKEMGPKCLGMKLYSRLNNCEMVSLMGTSYRK